MTPALTQKLNRGTFADGAEHSLWRTPPRKYRGYYYARFIAGVRWIKHPSGKESGPVHNRCSTSRYQRGSEQPSLVAHFNAIMEGCDMTQLITINDLNTTVNHEPRIRDLTIAERLGFADKHDVRRLVTRNKTELETYGEIVSGTVPETSSRGGRPGKSYYLNEGQCLVLCALSRTPQAAAVRKAIIEVFMAHRRGAVEAIQDHGDTQGFNTAQLIQIDTIVQRALIQHERRMERRSSDTGQRLAALDSWFKKFPAPERRPK